MDNRQAKIRRLFEGAKTEGEREAAAAALERTKVQRPVPGSEEWRRAMQSHQQMVAESAPLLGSPALTAAEVRTLRNWIRYVGTPWDQGAEEFARIHSKLMTATEEGLEPLILPQATEIPMTIAKEA